MKFNLRDEKWAVILNPKAGKQRLRYDWVKMYRALKRAEMEFQVWTTEYAGHATEIARHLVEHGFRNLLLVGGDGTINEVINGIYTANIEDKDQVSIALIPYGTGNDWARYWGLYKSDRKLSDRFYERRRVKVDLGCLTYHVDGEERKRYFINGLGVGFDGQVCKIMENMRQILGGRSWVYVLSLLSAVFKWKPTKMHLVYDNEEIQDEVFTIAVGNGCYTGGGLKQVPADPTDGIFHINMLPRPTVRVILKALSYLFRGELWNCPYCVMRATKRFKIKNHDSQLIEVDGIVIDGHGPYTAEVIPSALYMIV
ncbi:MAG: YegS/Rv2252/BmrU family lipid kinase [Paludibacteraceae bacterium]|nr:YegS/Rv2252/BmrU family lipid kinase [Paludibacteraceae bacterium]MBR6519834.1 YegS/Rv2252/BmrU family lipid kinase [Paludibacteraceae bacterium]